MTTLRAPAPSSLSRKQHLGIAISLTLAAVSAVAWTGYQYYRTTQTLGETLIKAPVNIKGNHTTWGKMLDTESPLIAAFKCSNTAVCKTWFNTAFNSRLKLDNYLYLIMGLFMASIFAWKRVPSLLVMKDPGQGKWAGLDDPGILDVVPVPVKDKRVKTHEAKLDKWSPRTFYLGHMLPWKDPDGFDWKHPRLAYLRERKRHENVLVSGAPGSGKTRGMFRQNIILDAEQGSTAIVFDLKWPQTDSGFKDLILYWHKRGRPVYVFAPFSPNSMRLPLLEGIDTLDEALKLARTIIAPPEYDEETGKYYKDIERRALAAMILAIAQSPTPTMKELQRLGQMNVAEFEAWYRRQQNPEIKANLKAMFDQRVDQISATLAGTLSTLQVFFNEHVARATTAGVNANETIPTKKAIKEGALIIIGIESKHIQDGSGAILIQLVKRRLDRDILDVADESKGGRVPKTVTYYLDELPGLGRLPYLMANLAQLRSKGVCLMLGVQNSDQGSVVYKREYWRALSTNNLGTRIDFIQGTSQEDAKNLSEEIGETTVYAAGATRSNHAFFGSPFSPEARKGESIKLERRRLLSLEEIKRFPPDMAVVFAKGQNPMLVATPAIDTPSILLRTPDGKHIELKNQLYPLWQKTMGDVQDLEAEVDAVVRSISISGSDKVVEVVRAAPEYWQDWLGALLDDGAMCRKQHTDDKIKIMIRRDTLSERLAKERDINYFISCGWLKLSDNEEELTITQDGLDTATKVLRNSLLDFLVRGPALYWLRKHNESAHYTPETLTVPLSAVEEMYNLVPDLPRTTVDGIEHVIIPLSDPKALSEAISRAEIELNRSGEGRVRRAPSKKALKKSGMDHAFAEAPDGDGLPDPVSSPNAQPETHMDKNDAMSVIAGAATIVDTEEEDTPDPPPPAPPQGELAHLSDPADSAPELETPEEHPAPASGDEDTEDFLSNFLGEEGGKR